MGLLNKIKNHFNKDKNEADKAKAPKAVAKSADKKPAAKPEDKKTVAKAADKKLAAKPEAKKTVDKKPAAKAEAKPAASIAKKGVLPGLFSVSPNKKVRFSMGNLQFNPKNYEFRFALHQYDRIGNDNIKIASNYDGWIDLFGYGTSGYMGIQPYESSTDTKQYLNQDINGTNYDWGVYNPINNGGNKAGIWRTLTEDEWVYLNRTRPNASKLRASARVNGIYGYIILPDDFYEHRVSVPFDSTPDSWDSNSYDLKQWATFESAGAVFMPCCGRREGTSMAYDPVKSWFYWTSTGYRYLPDGTYAAMFGVTGSLNSFNGFPVRLVQDVK